MKSKLHYPQRVKVNMLAVLNDSIILLYEIRKNLKLYTVFCSSLVHAQRVCEAQRCRIPLDGSVIPQRSTCTLTGVRNRKFFVVVVVFLNYKTEENLLRYNNQHPCRTRFHM